MSSLKNEYGKLTNGIYTRKNPIFLPLTIDGELTGDTSMAVDGSVTPVEFWVKPLPNQDLIVRGLTIRVGDNGTPEFDGYGNIVGPLTNGLEFFVESNGVQLPSPTIIKRNADYLQLQPRVVNSLYANNIRIIDYDVSFYSFSDGLTLFNRYNDRFVVKINDNLSTLSLHEIGIYGFYRATVINGS